MFQELYLKLRRVFVKTERLHKSESQIIHRCLEEHRQIVEKHNCEKEELQAEKEFKIQANEGIETLHMSQEFNLKLLRLLAKQRSEREQFNSRL